MISFKHIAKNIVEATALISVVLTGTPKMTEKLIGAGVYGSSALNVLAKDAEDAAIKSTDLNKLERAHEYTLRLAEIRQLEAGIVDPKSSFFRDYQSPSVG